jgi:putative tricarboxylic transport membrane protein
MRAQRVWMALPYAVLFVVAVWFYRLATQIAFTHRGANLGPDFWPRMALVAMMIICAVQVGRLLVFGRADDKPGVIDFGEKEDEAPRSTPLLAAGVVLTIAYGFSLMVLGFLISTFLFLVLFTYLGRYRAHVTIWLSSFAGTVLLVLLFQRVVYVSLPRGIAPFDRVTDLLLGLF